MLEVRGLRVSYRDVPAVRGVDVVVHPRQAVAVLGRNGAGKTSTLQAIAGAAPVVGGSIELDGADISKLAPERRVAAGIALCPEGRGVFPDLDVRENLLMGAYHRRRRPAQLGGDIERVTVRFPRLRERLTQRAGSLSGGEQQMLAVARALMSEPTLLMIDEPSLGLAPNIVEELYELLGGLRNDGLTLLIVEQYVELALGFADHVFVLEKGVVALEGPAADLARSPQIIDAYLSSSVGEDAGVPAR